MADKDNKVQVKGDAIISIPIFIIKKFGKSKYIKWLNLISPEAKKVYSSPINKSDWYPMQEIIVEPTLKVCDLFYNKSLRGAWESGRFSAEYGLKGIYKVLVRLSSPLVLIKKGTSILPSYYKPSELEIVEHSKGRCVVHIKKFPGISQCIEYRIAGWMERAVEITGCKHVTVKITKSLANHDRYTEYIVTWK